MMPTPELTPAQERLLRSMKQFFGVTFWHGQGRTMEILESHRFVKAIYVSDQSYIDVHQITPTGRRWLAERDAERGA